MSPGQGQVSAALVGVGPRTLPSPCARPSMNRTRTGLPPQAMVFFVHLSLAGLALREPQLPQDASWRRHLLARA